MIAALFVETGGCYFGLPDVDPWDKDRDARLYAGPHPVVAHPPCERWGRFDKGPMYRQDKTPGADDGCFAAAMRAVHLYSGVIEHPAHSKAWKRFGIPAPPANGGWIAHGLWGWTCQVEQGNYGHRARKKTWLYAISFGKKPQELTWGHSGQRLPSKRLGERGYASARRCGIIANMCSAHRQRTPIPFRDLLISIAQSAKGSQHETRPNPDPWREEVTRQEHLDWCKQRAMQYVEIGDYQNAVASMLSDLSKHPETEASSQGICAQLGMFELMSGPTKQGITRFIQGFN